MSNLPTIIQRSWIFSLLYTHTRKSTYTHIHVHTCSASPTPVVWLLVLTERSIAGIKWEISHHAVWLDSHLTGVLRIKFLREVGGGNKSPTHFFSRRKALVSCAVWIRGPPELLHAHLRASIHAGLVLRGVHTAGGHIWRQLVAEEGVSWVMSARGFSEALITCGEKIKQDTSIITAKTWRYRSEKCIFALKKLLVFWVLFAQKTVKYFLN